MVRHHEMHSMTNSRFRIALPLCVAYAAAIALGCGDQSATSPSGEILKVERMSGDSQSDTVASTLSAPVVIHVTSPSAEGAAGASVEYLPSGGGRVTDASRVTDQLGMAQAVWVLDTIAGRQSLVVKVRGGNPVTFYAWATAGVVHRLTLSADSLDFAAIDSSIEVTASNGFD